MTTVIVHHTVADFDTWKAGYDGHESTRRSHGCLTADVLRGAEDGNTITVVTTWPTADAARGFASDPTLKDVMSKAGVIGAPDIKILDEVESIAYEPTR